MTYENSIYGCPDLMIRSDRINSIFNKQLLTKKEESVGAPLMNLPFHYIIVDIKHSKIWLRADGKHVQTRHYLPIRVNLRVYKVFKGTNLIMLIIGKLIEGKEIYSEDFMDSIGQISYNSVDAYYKASSSGLGIGWMMWLHTEKDDSVSPPSNSNLYPNMKNKYDDKWRRAKKRFVMK